MNKNEIVSNWNLNQSLKVSILLLLAFSFLSGCGNSEQESFSSSLAKESVKKYSKDATLTGSVINEAGPVKTGKVEATDNKGAIIATALVDESGRYSLVIPAGTELPLLLTAYPQTELTSDILKVAVIEPSLKKYDINTLTTKIADKAKSMGGYTYANMRQAAMSSTAIPDANKTTGGFRGDPTKQYGGWH